MVECPGMESQSLVWITDAQSPTRYWKYYSGWSFVASFTSLCLAGSDPTQRSADYLPDHGIQHLAQRLLLPWSIFAGWSPPEARSFHKLRCTVGTIGCFQAQNSSMAKNKSET